MRRLSLGCFAALIILILAMAIAGLALFLYYPHLNGVLLSLLKQRFL